MLRKKPRCRAADLILADINNNYEIDSSSQSEQSNVCSSDVAGIFDNPSILSSTISFNSDVNSFGTPSLKDEEILDSDEDAEIHKEKKRIIDAIPNDMGNSWEKSRNTDSLSCFTGKHSSVSSDTLSHPSIESREISDCISNTESSCISDVFIGEEDLKAHMTK